MTKSTTYSSVVFSWFLLITLGIIWGLSFMGVELALRSYTPLTIATFRIVFAALLLFALCIFTGNQLPRISDKNGKRILLHCFGMGLFSNAIPFTLLSWGQINVSSSFAGISMAVVPLVVLPLSHYLIPNQRMTKVKLIGFVIGFIGVVILVNPESSSTSIISAVFCLMGAACYSFSTVFIQKNSAKTNKLVLIGWSIIFSAFIMMPVTLFYLPPEMPSSDAFLSVAWLGGVSTGLAFLGYVRLIEKIGAVKTSTVAYFLPVFGIIWGNIFLDELITLSVIVGCATILIGVFLATSKKIKKLEGEARAK